MPYLGQAMEALARAFLHNPVSRIALAELTPKQRFRKLRRLHGSIIMAGHRYGKLHMVRRNGRIAAVSIAYPPGSYPFLFRVWLLSGVGASTIGPRYTWRYAMLGNHLHHLHIREPHWYLFILGVTPIWQGKGLGGALLRHLSETADREAMCCYLETDKHENVIFYRRHGYDVVHEGPVPYLHNLKIWTMLRPPRQKRFLENGESRNC